jgi:hypothetical protein
MKRRPAGSDTFPDNRFGSAIGEAMRLAKQNPVQTALLAAAAGWLIHRITNQRAARSRWHRRMRRAEAIPVLNTGQARVYDPDASPRHPMLDTLDSRREMSARV